MAGLYSIIEGATGHRDALIWPSLGKSARRLPRCWSPPTPIIFRWRLGVGRGSPPQHRDDREDHPGDVRPRRQRPAAHGARSDSNARTVALREGLAKLSGAAREPDRAVAQHHRRQPGRRHRRDRSDCRSRCGSASRKRRRHSIGRWPIYPAGCCPIAVIFLGIIITAGVLIALSIRLPLASDHGGDARDHDGRLRPARAGNGCHGRGRRDGARGGGDSAKTPSPSARPKTSCAPRRRRPRARCSN